MSANQSIAMERTDGIDVVAIVRTMWRYRYLIGTVTITFALVAVYLALTAQEIYRAEIIITEVHDQGLSGSGGGLAGQLGGLAGLAGLNLTGGGAGANSQAVLASRRVAQELIKANNLVPLLTANSGKGATLWFAVKRFQERVLLIHDDALKGFTSVTVDWTDPVTAAKWANEIVAITNELVRAQDLEEATRNVAYLNKQIDQTKEVEIQRALSNLVENETKKLMLANARSEYAFRVIDPAVAPELRHSPKRALWVLSGTVLGFFLGTSLAIAYDAFRRR